MGQYIEINLSVEKEDTRKYFVNEREGNPLPKSLLDFWLPSYKLPEVIKVCEVTTTHTTS